MTSKISPGTTCGATTIVTAAATEVEEEVEKTEEEVHSPHLQMLELVPLSLEAIAGHRLSEVIT